MMITTTMAPTSTPTTTFDIGSLPIGPVRLLVDPGEGEGVTRAVGLSLTLVEGLLLIEVEVCTSMTDFPSDRSPSILLKILLRVSYEGKESTYV